MVGNLCFLRHRAYCVDVGVAQFLRHKVHLLTVVSGEYDAFIAMGPGRELQKDGLGEDSGEWLPMPLYVKVVSAFQAFQG